MPIIASDSGGGSFTPAPQGTHAAVCVDVVDLGIQKTQFGEKARVKIVWQIAEQMDDGRPYIVSRTYTLSLNEKAKLREDLESWRGKAFSDNELRGFDLEKLLDVPAMLNVVHKTEGDRTFANVRSVMPLMKGMEAPKPDPSYTRVQDREPRPEEPEGWEPEDLSDETVPF